MELDIIKKKINYYVDNNMMFAALLYASKLIENDRSEHSLFQYADVLRLCGFFSKSEAVFLQINVESIPSKYRYIYHLYFGQLYMDMNKTKEAKEQFRKCMEFENCDTVPYIYMATLFRGEESVEDAIHFLEKALEKQGDIDEVYYNLSTRFAIKGDLNLATEMINKCLDIDPLYPNATNIKNDLLECQAIQKAEMQ
jgi:tetratricopeptide (TPR) repeat protein